MLIASVMIMIEASGSPLPRPSWSRKVRLTGPAHDATRKAMAMSDRHEATGNRRNWVGTIVLLAVLLLASAGPSHAWGRHGVGGFHRGFHGFRGPRITVGIWPFWGPAWGWGPYWAPYAYPNAYSPVVVAPPPQVYVQPSPPASAQPSPPASWYYCEHPQGYYPYVPQCPGGWRQVPATPPQ